ncbi:uncharacterized protein APUU_80503A [Aspergillus puulaauensis]|uniref:Uncharacterized protein n=1 Tax=Aspergillus puulaauensis TaxID=1220207 RepID=A0A7R7XYR5_9EURO|nr:uncharacterized protein APUU_80503A [Aspergillus puulaauensis]BCS30200.1 hypothetical protein APUU_80503A [Aspergillus puulaauensis]
MGDNVAATPAREAEADPGYTPTEIPLPLTWAKTNPLSALHFERVDDLPEFPVSHEHGHAYVVKAGARSREELVQMIHSVQYAWSQQNGRKEQVYSTYLNCHARKWTWKCSGIYCCEFLDQKIRSYHHTSVDDSIWQEMERHQGPDKLLGNDLGKRNAYNYYRSKATLFKMNHACIDQLFDCKPVFKRLTPMGVDGVAAPYIGCSNDTGDLLSKHHRAAGLDSTTMDLELLEELFNKDLLPPDEVWCDGAGILSQEILPPIPKGSYDVAVQKKDRGLSTKQFLESPQLAEFCGQHNASSLAEIHPSFRNTKVIDNLIRKERLKSRQTEDDINGLVRLKETDGGFNEYIQEHYKDGGHTMVLCAYNDQLKVLSQMLSFHIDTSVKRVRSQNVNEILFTTFLPEQHQVITFLRVFSSSDSVDSYFVLFERAFALLARVSGTPVHFRHHHGFGFSDIVIEVTTLYSALGMYLSAIDPENRDVLWNLASACSKMSPDNLATLKQRKAAAGQPSSQSFSPGPGRGRSGAREKYSSLVELIQKYAKPDKDDIIEYKCFLQAILHRPNPNAAIEYYRRLEREEGSRKRPRLDSSLSASTSSEVEILDISPSPFRQCSRDPNEQGVQVSDEQSLDLSNGDNMDAMPSIEPPEPIVPDDTPSYEEKRRELESQKAMAEFEVQLAQAMIREMDAKIRLLELKEEAKELDLIEQRQGLATSLGALSNANINRW